MVSFQKSDTPTPLFIDVSGDFNRHEWGNTLKLLAP